MSSITMAGSFTGAGAELPGRLPLTGERTVPGVAQENYWFRRHEQVYRDLTPYCAEAVVLEAGCGEGYGADLSPARPGGWSHWTATPRRWRMWLGSTRGWTRCSAT